MEQGYVDAVIRVRSEDGRRVLARKRCLAHGPKGGAQTAHFLFAADELPVEPCRPLRLDAYLVPHRQESLPKDEESLIVPRDMRARIYGEPAPGKLPAIYNLSVAYASNSGFQSDARVTLRWSEPFPCPTVIETWGAGVNDGKVHEVEPGRTEAEILKFWPGHKYRFRLTSTGPTGLTWKTPLYEIRIPRLSEIGPIRQEEYPEQFVTLAPRRAASVRHGLIRYLRQLEVANGDFEQGLAGWNVAGGEAIEVCQSQPDLGVKWGRNMAGWIHDAGTRRKQALAKGTLSQSIATVPGHTYLLSAWVRTRAAEGSPGNTRARLLADPEGGDELDGQDSSQWYWTAGRWMRFEHRFTARAKRATIGLGLFRWWDVDLSAVHVDHVSVFDLGPAPPGPEDAGPRGDCLPKLALVNRRMEADQRVEAELKAPPGYLITGIGSRAHDDNVTTMWLRVQRPLDDGRLGPPEYLRSGWEADAGLEAEVTLPPGYVLTSVGLNCMHNDVSAIKAESAELVRTASGASR